MVGSTTPTSRPTPRRYVSHYSSPKTRDLKLTPTLEGWAWRYGRRLLRPFYLALVRMPQRRKCVGALIHIPMPRGLKQLWSLFARPVVLRIFFCWGCHMSKYGSYWSPLPSLNGCDFFTRVLYDKCSLVSSPLRPCWSSNNWEAVANGSRAFRFVLRGAWTILALRLSKTN